MRNIRIVFCTLFLLLSVHSVNAQSKSSSLLWRISGNGLQKPSYLYGTMHLKDRRLFFFTDSLYQGIENSSGFAMEIDPNELMDSLFSTFSVGDTSSLLKDILDKKQYDRVSKKLEKKLGIPAGEITRKKIVEMKKNFYNKIRKDDDMKTAMDLYLFDIAQKQGKYVGGIEDVSDQLNLRDEIGKDIDVNKYIDDGDDAENKALLEKMIAVYLNADIEKLEQMVNASGNTKDYELIKRNIKMSVRMDSLAHIRNSFFAVGAAHLPGDSGVIKLLRQRGFIVEAVTSSKKITPESYSYKPIDIPWVKITSEDSAYEVEMPGKSSELKLFGEGFKMKMYADVINNVAYMTGFAFISDDSPENRMQRMINSFASKDFKKLEEKKITHNGMSGTELICTREKIFYRIRLFVNARKLYMVMMGGERKENIYSGDAERFLKSFVANTKLEAKTKNWVDYTNSSKAFSLSFPQKPAVEKVKNSGSENGFETHTCSAMDVMNNAYYMIVISDTRKGYYVMDDSLIFNSKLEYYRQNKMVVENIREFEFSGYPAMSFSAKATSDGVDYVSKLLIVSRGNRSYTLAAVTEKGKEDFPEVTKFFRSFQLEPYQLSDWASISSDEKLFTTWAPSPITKNSPDTAALSATELRQKLEEAKRQISYNAFEPAAPINYNITIQVPSAYYWTKDDSSLLQQQLSAYYTDTASYLAKNHPGRFDSLIYKKAVLNGTAKGYEILVKNASQSYYKRVRIFRNGDSVYHLFAMASPAMLNDKNSIRFFEDFRFVNEGLPTTLFNNKTGKILNDLMSTDSATRSNAAAAFKDTQFSIEELPLLHSAFLKSYPPDTVNYNSVTGDIAEKIGKINDSSTVTFIKANYASAANDTIKMQMLQMLATQQTEHSMLLLKEIILKNPPVKESANRLMYVLDDSILLAKELFPATTVLLADTVYGPGLLYLLNKMIDSNLLDRNQLIENKNAVLKNGRWQLNKLKSVSDQYLSFADDLINALGKIGDNESVALLKEFLTVSDLYVKNTALLALVRINKPVSPIELRKIAADPGYRVDLYEALAKLKKESLFPKDLLSQQKFAESYLYNYANEEGEMDVADINYKLISEKTTLINGNTSRYYVYKISIRYDDEITSYTAICGAFDMNRFNPLIKNDDYHVRIFYDEKFSIDTAGKLFSQYIAELKGK